jgi:hypothetical protein
MLADIGIAEGNVHRTLHALRFLELLDEEGHPTHNFEAIQVASPEEYQNLLEGLVRHAYSEVWASGVDPSHDQLDVINNHFRRYAPTSQRYRQVTLFLALCREAGIEVLDAPRDRSTRKPVAPSATKKVKSEKVPHVARDNIVVPAVSPPADLRTQYLQVLVDTVRHIGERGEVPPRDLLERIETLLGVAAPLSDRADSV